MVLTPVALPPALPSELLEYILTHQAYPTTVVICQPRAVFISSLIETIKQKSHREASPPLPDLDVLDDSLDAVPEVPSQRHSLLIPTLHQVATSRHIHLIFLPTVTHLRAYLAPFPPPETKEPPPKREWDKQGTSKPLLVAFGLVGLHKDTSEWSAQGLGTSLAELVEAGARTGRRAIIIEERSLDDNGDVQMEDDETETSRVNTFKVWEERVPMLNGSVRRAGLESEGGGWSGRTVEVGRILARWFKFRKGDWDNENK